MEVKSVLNHYNPVSYNSVHKNNSLKSSIIEESNINHMNTRDHKITEKELIKSIESANKELVVFDRRFEFSIHEKTKQIMVKIIDVTTDEVIWEIPPEKILDLVAAIWEISGLIIDEHV
ncbi:MAG TPA: flagellar protein FlaG [Tissierellia bacterium]|nr:flagellar protein FlaG [Tissierellia bacterium]